MEANYKMKVERIYSGEITIDKFLKEFINTQINNLVTKHLNNNDSNIDCSEGSEQS